MKKNQDGFSKLLSCKVRALERIANSLETIIDKKKKTLRMFDVDRGKVYGKHLGKKLR